MAERLPGRHRGRDRDLAHALHPAGDDEVGGSAEHCLRGEMDGLLRGPALPVDGDARYFLRQPGREPGCPGDVTGLRPDRVDAAEDDVVDGCRVDAGAGDQRGEDVSAEIGRMGSGETAAAPADRCPDRVNDECIGHVEPPGSRQLEHVLVYGRFSWSCHSRRRRRGRKAAPGPRVLAWSAGFEIPHRSRDRQPQPMHESRPSRRASSASIWSSSRCRQLRDSLAQSARVGVR